MFKNQGEVEFVLTYLNNFDKRHKINIWDIILLIQVSWYLYFLNTFFKEFNNII